MDNKTKEYCNDYISIKLQNGIFQVKWLVELADYEFIDKCVKKGIELLDNKSFPMLLDISKLNCATKEARQRLSENDSLIGIKAVAIIHKSGVQKILYVIYKLIQKPKIQTKLFKNKVKAIEWLQQYK